MTDATHTNEQSRGFQADSSNQSQSATRERGGRIKGRIVVGLLILAAATAGVAVGVHWCDDILRQLGRPAPDAQTAAADAGQTQLWTCGMHPQVIQEKPGLCPICNMQLTPVKIGDAKGATGGERKVKYWWDPMIGPSSISDKPGKSAMGMDLVPVYEDQPADGEKVTIDPVVVQNMGIRVASVREGSITKQIRAVGYLAEAQPNTHDVNLRVSGWIEKLYTNTEGMHIEKGSPLFELYSPEVLIGLKEYVLAREAIDRLPESADRLASQAAEELLKAARLKLELWGIGRDEYHRLSTLPTPTNTVTFYSPITGHLVEKLVVEGAAVKSGDRILRIVDHSTLWLDAQVYEQDLPFISLGGKAIATVESMPGHELGGEVVFIHPHVDPMTRTATVRMTIPNPTLSLRPGMYATAVIRNEIASQTILIPREAIIDTGARQVAFVSLGEGNFEPRELQTGVSGDGGMVQVLKGLSPGDTVVTSGQFLLDAESRMREAIQKHLSERLLKSAGPSKTMQGSRPDQIQPAPEPVPHQTSKRVKGVWTKQVDLVVNEYLEIARQLGALQQTDAPLDPAKLAAAAQALARDDDGLRQQLAGRIAEAAGAMRDRPLEKQRELFMAVSEAAIALTEHVPPSKAVSEELLVIHCPMVDASWLQTTGAVANPYYASEMKQCGAVARTIEASEP